MESTWLNPKKLSAVNHVATEFWKNDYDDNDLYHLENINLDESKGKMELRKRVFEYENLYLIENRAKSIHINDKEVKNIDEFNLLHNIINNPKRYKYINIHCSPILQECMNTRKAEWSTKTIRIY